MASLYEIDYNIKAVLDGILSGEVTEDGEVADDTFEKLEALQAERKAKMENIALYIKNITAEAAAIKAEESALKERRERLERKAERLSGYMAQSMAANNEPELSSPRFSAKYRETESTDVFDKSLLPKEFIKVKTTEDPDKVAIKAAIKAGQEVAGARLVINQKVNIK